MQKDDHVQFSYNKIDENIFLGTNFCCQIHFDENLLKKGVVSDLSLEGERVDSPYGISQYLWLPIKDHHAPTLHQFQHGVAFIEQTIAQNGKVYIHCKNGHGRAPTMTAAYYIKQGMSVEDAIHKIMLERSEIHINAEQRKALETYRLTL